MLLGAEVKSIREGHANLQDGYARVDDGEVWLHGLHVMPYAFSHGVTLDPVRKRKLLLHRKQIEEIARATAEKGVTLVPLRVYFKDGRAKVELAVARGKARYDKRQAIAASGREAGDRARPQGLPPLTRAATTATWARQCERVSGRGRSGRRAPRCARRRRRAPSPCRARAPAR